jgi:Glycosyl transferase family 2
VSRHLRPVAPSRRPTVTVVMPCFNYGRYLPVAAASVLDQAGVDVELIVIDDASTDGSDSVVRELARGDERIRTIIHERNRGHIATYNEGLAQAQGDHVVLLSADDALTPGALSRAAALLDAEPGISFVYGFPLTFEDELPPARTRVRNWTVWSGEEWIGHVCGRGINPIHCPEVVMRASVQHAIGGYEASLPHSGDLEMWLRAASAGDVGRVNGPVQAYYRIHPQSMQRTVYAGHLADLEGRLAAFAKVLVGPPTQLLDGPALFTVAQRSLAIVALRYARLAYDGGWADREPVDEYLDFARRVWPEVRQLRGWRAAQRRAGSAGDRRRAHPARGGRRLATDLGDRLRWRRWRWSGT